MFQMSKCLHTCLYSTMFNLREPCPLCISSQNISSSGADPGFPIGGGGAPTLVGRGANLQHRHFSVKTYVKTKEFGPVRGSAPETLVCRSTTVVDLLSFQLFRYTNKISKNNKFIFLP